ncbi:YdeI/OmpD-associated family protein [Chitinophaga sp.]|uniref:YdeI/OmpD-associated family protein n=1 Tax=Chitinophaga sp. TaxID=1869181 RepID=UPI0031D29894
MMWEKETEKLRKIILDCGLNEAIKWGKPCFDYEGKNIVIIQGFKDYCALLFFKGALLTDPDGILVKTGENTQVGRQARFTTVKEITQVASILKACIYEAIEVERAGLKVDTKKNPVNVPAELQQQFDKQPKFKKAFEALTPGRQKAYVFFFSGAKQSKTREARIEKYMPWILAGKGINDR